MDQRFTKELARKLFFVFAFLACFFTLHSVFASPEIKLRKVQVWPTSTYLGQPFFYRIELDIPKDHLVMGLSQMNFGQVKVTGKPKVKRRKAPLTGLVINIPLAVYMTRTYGSIKIPKQELRIISPDGESTKLRLPAQDIVIKSKYTWTKQFKDPKDPKLSFQKQTEKERESHDYRIIPIALIVKKKPEKKKQPWLYFIIAGSLVLLFLAFFLFYKLKKPVEEMTEQPNPYLIAQQKLLALQSSSPQDQLGVEKLYAQLSHCFKTYLELRVKIPAQKKSAREMNSLIEKESHTRRQKVVWGKDLQEMLLESEQIRFAKQLGFAKNTQETMRKSLVLLDQIESWQREYERILEQYQQLNS